MPTLTEAERAASAAQATYSEAVTASAAATAHAADLREYVRTGRGQDVTPDALARADQSAEHSALLVEAARVGLADLQEAVQTGRRDSLCDEIISTLPQLGSGVSEALDAVSAAVSEFVGRVADYNAYASSSAARLSTLGAAGPRVTTQRHGSPSVDRISLGPLHGDRNLAAELLPALRQLGAAAYFLTEVRTVAGAAAPIASV